MTGIIGLLLSLMTSFCETALRIINQQTKINSNVLTIYRGLGPAIVLLPFILFIKAPTSILFYGLIILNSLCASISYNRMFDSIK